jgi:hypothetical protein
MATMLRLAADYDKLADRAARGAADTKNGRIPSFVWLKVGAGLATRDALSRTSIALQNWLGVLGAIVLVLLIYTSIH